MPLTSIQHRRAHNLLLIKKLLECRDGASPFTLIIDTLKQSAKPLLRDIVKRAAKSRNKIVYVSWEAVAKPQNVDVFLPASSYTLAQLESQLRPHLSSGPHRTTIIFDTLNILLQTPSTQTSLPSFLSSLITPHTSLFAVYHADIPSPPDPLHPYSPNPSVLLSYLATSVLTTHSLAHILAARRARQRSLAEPSFGLAEEREGIIVGLGSNDQRGTVLELEYRRKSGRAVHELFLLSHGHGRGGAAVAGEVVLLDDYPLYRSAGGVDGEDGGMGVGIGVGHGGVANAEEAGEVSTFSLGLTEKQRRDRGEVVLPYFDAQGGDGIGDGGRILYEMGEEDDFDDEEDEI